MEDSSFQFNSIEPYLAKNYIEQFTSIIDKQSKKDEEIKKWMKRAKKNNDALTLKLEEKDQKISDLKLLLNNLSAEHQALKTKYQRLKEHFQSKESSTSKKPKEVPEKSRKKSNSKSPNENKLPEKNKKLKGDWISVDKPASVDRRTSLLSLSLSKPSLKLKQTHLNFMDTKESFDADATYCSELEHVIDTPEPSTSPSRFRSYRKSTKVLTGLKETKKEKDENPFDCFEDKRVVVKAEPEESQGMNTAIILPTKVGSYESRESDVIILPTQLTEIFEINDSNDSNIKLSGNFAVEPVIEEPVQKVPAKSDRPQYVPGFCRECVAYYNQILPNGFDRNDPFVVPCQHELGRRPRPDTPEGFWNPIFTPTQK